MYNLRMIELFDGDLIVQIIVQLISQKSLDVRKSIILINVVESQSGN